MSILKKQFRIKARPEAGPASPPEPYVGPTDDKVKVDSGSPVSMVKQAIAKRLCVPENVVTDAQIKGVGGGIVVGVKVPVEIQVGKRRGIVHAFVPLKRLKDPTGDVRPENLEPYDADENVVGWDFIKKSKARIHGGAKPGSEFRGVTSSDLRRLEMITDPRLKKVARAEARRVLCIVPPRGKRHQKRP